MWRTPDRRKLISLQSLVLQEIERVSPSCNFSLVLPSMLHSVLFHLHSNRVTYWSFELCSSKLTSLSLIYTIVFWFEIKVYDIYARRWVGSIPMIGFEFRQQQIVNFRPKFVSFLEEFHQICHTRWPFEIYFDI